MEILLFLFPLLWPAIPALTKLAPNWVAFGWVVLVAVYFYINGCGYNWKWYPVRTPYASIILIYSILCIFSTFINPMHDRALSFLFQTLALILVYWIFSQILFDVNLNRLLMALILGSVINAIIFAFAFMKSSPEIALEGLAYGQLRPVVLGYKANSWPFPSMIGWALIVSIIVHGKSKRNELILMSLFGIILLGSAILNMSRSVLLGISISTIFVLITHPRARVLFLWGLVVIALVFIITLPVVYPELELLLRLRSGLTGREELWPIAMKIIEEHPLFGLGPANFRERLLFESSFMRNGLAMILGDPTAHNLYLHIGAEIGVFGPFLAFCLLGIFTYRCNELWSKLKNSLYFTPLVAISAIMVAGFVRSLVETEFILQHGFIGKNLLIIILFSIQDRLATDSINGS